MACVHWKKIEIPFKCDYTVTVMEIFPVSEINVFEYKISIFYLECNEEN